MKKISDPYRLIVRFGAILVVAALCPLFPVSVLATTEYSAQTGKSCGACHFEPAGGGKLTNEGEAFRDELRIKGLYKPLTPAQHAVRFIVGFLHTMTAIIWFGAILYVHILLKPAYASRGLPKGELILGWASIVIMAVTGTLLTVARVPSLQMLFHTRFGILLTIKIALFLIMASTAVAVTFFIGPRLKKRRQLDLISGKQDLTAEELLQFDGKDGRPAYIAFNGRVHDVSGSRLWNGGSHLRKHLAGSDLSEALKTAPHGEDKLLKMPVVGKLIPKENSPKPLPLRVFYFFAYMNLALIFLIVFVISLWRWW